MPLPDPIPKSSKSSSAFPFLSHPSLTPLSSTNLKSHNHFDSCPICKVPLSEKEEEEGKGGNGKEGEGQGSNK
jgi:hypothetical protein